MFEKCYTQQAAQKIDLRINCNKIKMMTNLVPSEEIIIEDTIDTIEIVEKYIYLGHEMRISRDN